jgi:negative regulator of sigma E activity
MSVEHAGDMVMLEAQGSSQVLGGGTASTHGTGSGVALADWSPVGLASRYEAAAVESGFRLGRDVLVVTVNEGGKMRARIWFDEDTHAPLGSEVYDGNEDLFRLSWLLDFDPNPRRIYTVLRDNEPVYDLVAVSSSDALPEMVGGYEKVDMYSGPSDSVHVYYSDGLFSFSVFVIVGEGATGPFVDAETMELGSGSYRWMLTPAELWVQWSGSGRTYVLVGDLPPDHLEAVLGELPMPSRGNIFSRLWNGIFG